MNIQHLERAGIVSTLKRLMKDFDEYYWAVAWGTNNQFSSGLVLNSNKIKRLVFGTHFYGTDPLLLKRFLNVASVRIMPNDCAGTFHPKVYLFIKGVKAAAIVGSANFTNGAMTMNNEAAILIEGASTDESIKSIKTMIEDSWNSGCLLDKDFLDDYQLSYITKKKHLEALESKRSFKKPKEDAANKELRSWDWDKFADMARKDPYHSFEQRLKLLQVARTMFSRVNAFSDLECNERQAIAGFLSKKVKLPSDCDIDWGWFCSMKAAGDYKNIVNNNNKYLSEALDYIPLSGEIRKEQFNRYKALFNKAFKGKTRKGGVTAASRLLTIKRPDTFICVSSRNKRGLGKDLGFAPTTLTFDKYWDEVIIPITESIWWQTDRPKGQDGLLWDMRSAMLDSIYYAEND